MLREYSCIERVSSNKKLYQPEMSSFAQYFVKSYTDLAAARIVQADVGSICDFLQPK